MSIIKGKAYWAKLDRATNMFDANKPRWSIDLSLDKKGVALMEEEGIPVKNKDDDRGTFVTFTKDKFMQDGTELPKPRLIDAKKNDMSGTLIGNGSVVKVAYYPYEWTYTLGNNARSGIKGILKGVQVLNLVEYIPKDDFEEETGFVSNTPTEAIEVPFE
jgi:hypothetical protein|tara:strand:+ start:3688 stop:4167 length:480 start_codon:yes stop_codon:yes gene_type:complete